MNILILSRKWILYTEKLKWKYLHSKLDDIGVNGESNLSFQNHIRENVCLNDDNISISAYRNHIAVQFGCSIWTPFEAKYLENVEGVQ